MCTHAEMLNFPTSVFHRSPFAYVHSKIKTGLVKEKACLFGRIYACFDEKALLQFHKIITLFAHTSLHGGVPRAHRDAQLITFLEK